MRRIYQTASYLVISLTSTTRLLVVGLTGGGKTYWTNQHLVSPAKSVAVWDPHRKYSVGYFAQASKVPAFASRWGICAPWNQPREFQRAFLDFTAEVMKRRMSLVVVDEVVLLVLMRCEGPLIALVSQAQNYGCAVVTVAQRAYSVPLTVRSQSSHVISFQQTDAHDIDALNSMAAIPGAFPQEKMKALKQGEYLEAVVRG